MKWTSRWTLWLKKLEKQIETINYSKVEVPKYALFQGVDMLATSDDIKDFEELIGVPLTNGRINWINQKLNESDSASMNGFDIKLSKVEKESKETVTIETLQKRVNDLENALRLVVQNSRDTELIKDIKKFLTF